ncbi:hypothetical protein [Eubacterium oxidoreducens]|uniref:Uncharacterized protein n=1 Tax=Eubacterium oxidoreducens TaxID=1732 RepID=A0A1G6B283_EUBOX|nr:hypothetical protein [Eubacterium oxidoreducens]SDB14768.1 hypothetical protein SAMN02910417_01077 [Eubacterium oxidoreducens]
MHEPKRMQMGRVVVTLQYDRVISVDECGENLAHLENGVLVDSDGEEVDMNALKKYAYGGGK